MLLISSINGNMSPTVDDYFSTYFNLGFNYAIAHLIAVGPENIQYRVWIPLVLSNELGELSEIELNERPWASLSCTWCIWIVICVLSRTVDPML